MSESRKIVRLKWLHTSDIHANLFGCDYRNGMRSMGGGISEIYSYIYNQLKNTKGNLIITDGGDNLQGQPLAYYYNFIDTQSPHLVSEVMNEMGYVCGVMGNHDIETGEETFERWMHDCKYPILGANVIDKRTGKPYLKPYIVIERSGIKIAILGMVTSAIPYCQPDSLWPHLQFEQMLPCAKQWVEVIKEQEHPDLLVGVFHSGYEGGFVIDGENAVKDIAEQVAGFDMICYGHDHHATVHTVANIDGGEVVCMSAACTEGYFAEADIDITFVKGTIESKAIHASVRKIKHVNHDALSRKYGEQLQTVTEWANQPICRLTETLDEREAFFGPSRFMDFIHQMQLEMTGADISIAMPCSYKTSLQKGNIRRKDLFSLLDYEEFVYTLRLSGEEIKKMLECSYGQWVNTMSSSNEHVLHIHNRNKNVSLLKASKRLVKRVLYNEKEAYNWRFVSSYDKLVSAMGMVYTVDVTNPAGERVTILSKADKSPFESTAMYNVAVSRKMVWDRWSALYAIGLTQEELHLRVVKISEKALPYFMIDQMAKQGIVNSNMASQWHFIPDDMIKSETEKDRNLLFPSNIVQEILNSFRR